jgi:hypothetical protein
MFIGKVFIPLNVTTTTTGTEGDISPEFAIVLIATLAIAGLFLVGYTIYTLIKVSRY